MMQFDFSRIRHLTNPFALTNDYIPDPRAAFTAWFEDFGRRLAPLDFADVPLYVVDAALAGPGDTLGFAGESLDLAYQEQIGPRWKGRGACFAVDLQQVQDQAEREEGNKEMQKTVFIRRALELALHELGHVLTHGRPFNPDILPAVAKQAVVECLRTPAADMPGVDVAWIGHDADFLRILADAERRQRAYSVLRFKPIHSLVQLMDYRPRRHIAKRWPTNPSRMRAEPFTEIKQTGRRKDSSHSGRTTCKRGTAASAPRANPRPLQWSRGKLCFPDSEDLKP